jgi:hypothetical protein
MKAAWLFFIVVVLAGIYPNSGLRLPSRSEENTSPRAYLGFDRNEYPGDANLAALRRSFAFAGYWLNPPPGSLTNTWIGRSKALQSADFGFLLLFNGRLEADLKETPDTGKLGIADATEAVAVARREGFPENAIIFLDQEEGGRMLTKQKSYIYAWVDGVNASGFQAGIYCSGIPFAEGTGITVTTADDIRQNAGGRKIVYWVVNDACPPSPGCAFAKPAPRPTDSGIASAEVWQFAQSPKRRDVAAGCPANYDQDGNCYPPAVSRKEHIFVDLNVATSADPSAGRSRTR